MSHWSALAPDDTVTVHVADAPLAMLVMTFVLDFATLLDAIEHLLAAASVCGVSASSTIAQH